jgi:hypothetical protein
MMGAMTEAMALRHAAVLAAILSLVALAAGCTPRPPRPANCRMADWEERRSRPKSDADTVVAARVTESCNYAITWAWGGTDYWHLVVCGVLVVEKGRWDAAELVFVDREFAPNDLMIDRLPFPFRPGRSFTFGLDTRERPPVVVWWEERKGP